MSLKELINRRNLFKGLGIAGGVLMSAPFFQGFGGKRIYLRPPGAVDETEIASLCIRCGLCVQVCPYKAIKLGDVKDGLSIGTPYIVARENPCWMCPDIPCVKVCPTGALDRKLSEIEKIKMGTAVIVDREECLSLKGLRCEVCYRECPLIDRAISIEYSENKKTGSHAIFEPVIRKEKCTGCGICEHKCVVEPPAVRVLPSSKTLFKYLTYFNDSGKKE